MPPIIIRSGWAKCTSPVARKIMLKPMATRLYIDPIARPKTIRPRASESVPLTRGGSAASAADRHRARPRRRGGPRGDDRVDGGHLPEELVDVRQGRVVGRRGRGGGAVAHEHQVVVVHVHVAPG